MIAANGQTPSAVVVLGSFLQMLHDVTAAVRALARRPGLSFTVILTLTLGIGANCAIFSAVDAILLRPLPYPGADRLVTTYESNLERRQSTMLVAPGRLEEWQRMNRSFDGLAASYFENMTDTSGPLPERVALAIVLLVWAGLLIRSFARLQQTSPGLDAVNVLTFRMSAQWNERPDALMNRQLRTIARLTAVPGIVSAAFSSTLPAGTDFPPAEFRIAGRDRREHLFTHGRSVSADYFRALHIPVLQGDVCRDDPAKPFQSVVVTRAFADRFFPGENPIGHFIQPVTIAGLQQRIDGIVGDVRENGVMKDAPALSYTCGLQPYWPDPYFIVRTDPARPAKMSTIRDAMREIEPKRAIYSVKPLEDVLADSVSQQRLNTILLSLFAATALLLAAVGLYGTLSQFVSQRRREIGLRMALGAQRRQVLAQVVTYGAIVTLIGIAAGLAGALALSRLMVTLVFGIPPRDPLTFKIVPLVLSAIAALATIAPARRAVRLEPMEALREE